MAEHGLSILIETGQTKVLFDSGNGLALEHNFKQLGINPMQLDCLIFSHGHWDHTGGLSYLAGVVKPGIKVFLHSMALKPKYSLHDGKFSYSGMPAKSIKWLKSPERKLFFCDRPFNITDDFWISGTIPRNNEIERVPSHFFLSKSSKRHDPISDDISLFIRTEKGIVVILGCCHSGIGNTLDYISDLTGEKKIYAVIGGMHLKGADAKRLEFSARILDKYKVEFFAPCHCTGQVESAYLYRHNPMIYQACHAGSCFEF